MAADSDFTDVVLPELPPSWEWKRLVELVSPERGICYGIVQPGAHDPAGIPMVNTQDVSNGIVNQRVEFRVAEKLNAKFKRSQLRGGEVLVTLVGANFGRVAVAPASYAGFNCARPVGVVPVEHNAAFVALALRAPFSQRLMQVWANTTAQPTLNLSDLARIPIALPPRTEQQRITEIVAAFDDKIDLNRRMNQTLEATAQALFRSWFVDFDPVRAKAAGRQPEAMDAEMATLFPSTFTEAPHGDLPDGWTWLPLDRIAHFLNGLALQKFPPVGSESLPVIKIAQLRRGSADDADQASARIPPEYVVQDGDILFSWSGSLLVSMWAGGRGALNQHLFKVTSATYPKWFYLLWCKEYLPEFQRIAQAKATTMGHIQRHHLTQALVAVPPPELIEAANHFFEPLLARWLANALESRTLIELRDTLLPKLLSGEIRVGAAEAQVAASA